MKKHTIDPLFKERMLWLILAGEITPSEAARLALVARVTVWRWCKEAGIDPDRARLNYLAKTLARTLEAPFPTTKRRVLERIRKRARKLAYEARQSHQRDNP